MFLLASLLPTLQFDLVLIPAWIKFLNLPRNSRTKNSCRRLDLQMMTFSASEAARHHSLNGSRSNQVRQVSVLQHSGSCCCPEIIWNLELASSGSFDRTSSKWANYHLQSMTYQKLVEHDSRFFNKVTTLTDNPASFRCIYCYKKFLFFS